MEPVGSSQYAGKDFAHLIEIAQLKKTIIFLEGQLNLTRAALIEAMVTIREQTEYVKHQRAYVSQFRGYSNPNWDDPT